MQYRDDRQYDPFVLCSLPILITFILAISAAVLWAVGALIMALFGLLSLFFSGEWDTGGYFSDKWPFVLFGLILIAVLGLYTYAYWLSVRGSTAVATIFRGE